VLDEWFESRALKAAIAASAVRDVSWGPKEAGTAYTLLFSWSLSDAGLFRSAGTVRGGMGALAAALATAARAAGAEIRTRAEVARIRVQDGRARGVALAGGEAIQARAGVSSAGPRATFRALCQP